MEIIFELNGTEYKYDPEKECAINPENLQDELVKHPSKVAFIGAVSSILRIKAERLKASLEELYAKLDISLRKTAVENGEKITEKAIESIIVKDKRYSQLREEYLNALEKSKLADSIVEAFKQRQFALVSLVSMLKTEQGGMLSVVKSETLDEVYDEGICKTKCCKDK